MQLSNYDRVVCLSVDKRYQQEKLRIYNMLFEFGVDMSNFSFFVDGLGSILDPKLYDQISPSPPYHWIHGDGAYAHLRAMKAVVAKALADGVRNLLWIEDDCVFTDKFGQVLQDATFQLSHMQPWDILYYGANHTWATTYEKSPHILHSFGSLTTHCVGISSRMFEPILQLPEVHVIDKLIADYIHPKYNCYSIWPSIAIQKPGFSLLSQEYRDYTHFFKCKGMNLNENNRFYGE